LITAALPPLILGIATLFATRLVYGYRRVAASDTLVLVLTIAGWTMIFLGVACLATPVPMLVVLGIFAMTVAKFREGERRALLWTLATAAEHGLPLAPSCRAFAARRSDEMARRAWLLAELLEAGMPLWAALKRSGNPLPTDAQFMVGLGQDPKAMVTALRESAERGGESEEAWRPIFDRTMYLLLVSGFAMLITTFVMVSIMPTFREIFSDFGTTVPAVTQLTIDVSNWLASYWYLFSPLLFYVMAVVLISSFFYVQGRIWLPWPLNWFFGRTDNPTVLRGLAICVAQKIPMDTALQRMGEAHPRYDVARRLLAASGETRVGKDWLESLLEKRFVTKAEAAVLNSASRAGNLEWALRELAEVGTRRLVYRAKTFMNFASPVCLLLVSFPIAVFVIGCFIPLVSLIQNLT